MIDSKNLKTKILVSGLGVMSVLAPSIASADTSIYGYVRADFIFDSDQNLGDELAENTISTSPDTVEKSSFRAHARQSRIGISHKGEDYSAKVEGDFFGSGGNEFVSNSRGFRVRHAYGTYKNITAGQTWSTFMDRDFIAFPTTVDFTGPSVPFVRQALLRLNLGNLDLAIENPQAFFRGDSDDASASEPIPDLVARYASTADNFSYYLSSVIQSLEVTGGAADGEDDSLLGLSAGVSFKLGASTKLQASVTSNAGRYLTYGFSNPSHIVVGNEIESVDHVGFNVALSNNVGERGQFNLSYSSVSFDDEFAGVAGSSLGLDDVDTVNVLHANYIYNATKNVTYSFEVSNLDQESFNGNSADNTRLQVAVQYGF